MLHLMHTLTIFFTADPNPLVLTMINEPEPHNLPNQFMKQG